ncbi:MAG: hypothetical protein NC906_05615, partial [Candidatus Omnitrophica bacterium]|nr:hypothetical protein [Candidatus Omnitrophota bacterium]
QEEAKKIISEAEKKAAEILREAKLKASQISAEMIENAKKELEKKKSQNIENEKKVHQKIKEDWENRIESTAKKIFRKIIDIGYLTGKLFE